MLRRFAVVTEVSPILASVLFTTTKHINAIAKTPKYPVRIAVFLLSKATLLS